MTVQVGIVNLLLETHGGARRQGDATWYILMTYLHIRFIFFLMTNGLNLFLRIGPFQVAFWGLSDDLLHSQFFFVIFVERVKLDALPICAWTGILIYIFNILSGHLP